MFFCKEGGAGFRGGGGGEGRMEKGGRERGSGLGEVRGGGQAASVCVERRVEKGMGRDGKLEK